MEGVAWARRLSCAFCTRTSPHSSEEPGGALSVGLPEAAGRDQLSPEGPPSVQQLSQLQSPGQHADDIGKL